jgi:hypothetical protein
VYNVITRSILQIPQVEEPCTAADQVHAITEFFKWDNAKKPALTVMKAVQLWYYGYPATKVTVLSRTHEHRLHQS